jgi:uncharacterized protein YhfF
MTDARIEVYWQEFLATQPPGSPYHDRSYIAEGFGDNPALADELAALVLSGIKTATCSALWEWQAEGNPIPEVGLLSITLSGTGDPICILETTEVTLRRYNEVDEDFARAEGEGDLSLAYWRDAHKHFFSRVLAKIGREFSEDMPLVCERFRVVHK